MADSRCTSEPIDYSHAMRLVEDLGGPIPSRFDSYYDDRARRWAMYNAHGFICFVSDRGRVWNPNARAEDE